MKYVVRLKYVVPHSVRGLGSLGKNPFYLVNTRMRSKRDIKMGRLCTPGGAVLEIVGGGVTFCLYFGYVYTLLWLS